jgi:phosphoribosylglycinamide formyltransferase 1
LKAMLDQHVPVTLVLADRPCPALDLAKLGGVATVLVDRNNFGYSGMGSAWDRKGFTEAVITALQQHDIGLVAMAGFMTILDASVFDSFPESILNTHPSLLPKFKGENAVQDALDAGVAITGCTIHYATSDLDGGPIIAQREIEVLPNDTKQTLHERIKTAERQLYPEILQKMLAEND